MKMVRQIALVIATLAGLAPSWAQGAEEITLRLTSSEVAAIVQAMGRQPMSKAPPVAFWLVQAKINAALEADPAQASATLDAITGIPQRAGDR
jgi:hypothetical protein